VWECVAACRKWRTELYLVLCVGSSTFFVELRLGSAGSGVLICMYCCLLAFGHFVWECEGESRKWRTEFYILLWVGSWTFCVGV